MSDFTGSSDLTGSSIFGIELINFMNIISGDDDSIKPEQTSNDYCERCGRLGQCSQIYVCEFTTDINGQYLSYDTFEFKSDSSESDSSDEEESDSSEEEDSWDEWSDHDGWIEVQNMGLDFTNPIFEISNKIIFL